MGKDPGRSLESLVLAGSLFPNFTEVCVRLHVGGQGQAPPATVAIQWDRALLHFLSLITGTKCSEPGSTQTAQIFLH